MKLKSTLSFAAMCCILHLLPTSAGFAQQSSANNAVQDTTKIKRSANESLNKYANATAVRKIDTRMLGAASMAASMLTDTARYNTRKGLPITELFKEDDLAYISKGGLANVVALFETVNKQLPKDKKLEFLTDSTQVLSSVSNPLELKELRMKISSNPATIAQNRPEWQEHVYQAYLARDYGSRLENTITITSATRELREEPQLELLRTDGNTITLAELLRQQQSGPTAGMEQRAVASFRQLTFPNGQVSANIANENYRRALLSLINLQQGDFNRHAETKSLIDALSNDLRLGAGSKVLSALRNSTFFDSNLPGNLGPVLVTEADVVDPQQIAANAMDKALELMTLTALHYGERDAVKLYRRLLGGQGTTPASTTTDFTKKRLGQLTYHGTEKIKSLGFGSDKTANMSFADLVLVAVAAPAAPVTTSYNASLSLSEVGQTVISTYNTNVVETSKSIFQLNPRVSLGSRYTTYKASYDPIGYANNAIISQNGLELRLESDLYFAKLDKMLETGLKPFIYPEFGVVMGSGERKVGYKGQTASRFGTIPQFKQNYINWGGHLGLNVGPVLVGMDATVLSTKSAGDPYRRFFDLSQAMTYYRYSFLARVLNLNVSKAEVASPYYLTFDVEVAGETNNEGTENKTRTQDGNAQIASKEWRRAYDRARPNGVYNQAIANQMILDGSVKASYPSANYAALHLGLVKSGFQFKVTAGLYNRFAIDGYSEGKGEWLNRLAKNTFKGSGFGAATLTYNFGSKGLTTKSRRAERNSVINGVASSSPVEESSSTERVRSGLRTRAIFMNRK